MAIDCDNQPKVTKLLADVAGVRSDCLGLRLKDKTYR